MIDLIVFKSFKTTGELLAYVLSRDPPLIFPDATFTDASGTRVTGPGLDIVVQDEYTHDWVVPIGDGLFLVYDTT